MLTAGASMDVIITGLQPKEYQLNKPPIKRRAEKKSPKKAPEYLLGYPDDLSKNNQTKIKKMI